METEHEEGTSVETAAEAIKAPRYTLGEAKRFKRGSNLGKIAAACGTEGAAMDDIVTATGFDADKVVTVLRAGRGSHGVDHEMSGHRIAGQREVDFNAAFVKVVPPTGYDHETMYAAEKEPGAPSTGERKQIAPRSALGEFRQFRPGTQFATIAAETASGEATVESLAAKLGLAVDRTRGLLNRMRVTHGVDYKVGDGKVVTLVGPEGADLVAAADAPRQASPAPDGEPRRSKRRELDERAAAGIMPERLVITSPTNIHRQKYADKLHDLADAGDWDGVASFKMKGIDTYSKLINRHRDRLLSAHRALAAHQAEDEAA